MTYYTKWPGLEGWTSPERLGNLPRVTQAGLGRACARTHVSVTKARALTCSVLHAHSPVCSLPDCELSGGEDHIIISGVTSG